MTSGSQSPLLKKPIGMGYVDFGNHKIGRKLEANLRGKKVEMAVTKMPFVATNYFK